MEARAGPSTTRPPCSPPRRRGDLPAFNQLVLHYQSLAYNIAYRLTGDEDLSADATQDAFIKAFQRLSQYRGGSFKSWLLRIVTNTCYDALRARKRRPTTPLESDEDEDDPEYDSRLIDNAERPEAYVMRQELAVVIQAAIGQLPPDQRTALVLSDVEGPGLPGDRRCHRRSAGHRQIAAQPRSCQGARPPHGAPGTFTGKLPSH